MDFESFTLDAPGHVSGRRPSPPVPGLTLLLDSTPGGVRLARRTAALVVHEWGTAHGTDRSDAAALVVAELASNAVLHAPVPARCFRLAVSLLPDALLRIAVSDRNPQALPPVPEGHEADPDAESGRGLLIVAALADRWGVDLAVPGLKTVWAELGP